MFDKHENRLLHYSGRGRDMKADIQFSTQSFCEAVEGGDRGVCYSAFDFGDIRLVDSGQSGKLLLRQARLGPCSLQR